MQPTRIVVAAVLCCLAVPMAWAASANRDDTTLTVSVLVTGSKHRSVFYRLGELFEKRHPGVTIRWIARRNEMYKRQIDDWLAGSEGPDVVYWQAGMRLREKVARGYLAPIDGLWRANEFDTRYAASAKASVTVDGRVYAVPYSYYQWGIYYRRSIFDRLNLEPPKSWNGLLRVCERLSEANIQPFTLGSENPWTTAAWFDYINLRLNGIAFHRDLVAGEVPFTDERVRAVFEHWRTLLEHECFLPFEIHVEHDWKSALPFMYHGQAAMTLMGNFLVPQIPEAVRSDIRFFRFPTIDPEVGRYEEAPTDVFALPRRSADNGVAKAFLAFIGSARAQSLLNNRIGKISTNRQARVADDYFIRQGAALLDGADALTQFFDRDARPALAGPAMQAFRAFMDHRDVDRVVERLEAVRRDVRAKGAAQP